MDWRNVGDLFYLGGVLLSVGMLVYGAWLCLTQYWADTKEKDRSSAVETPKNDDQRPFPQAKSMALTLMVISLPLSFDSVANDSLTLGIRAYEDSKYFEAISHFKAAARTGNSRAQEILGFMYLHGSSSYGSEVPVDRTQAMHWFVLAAKDGREVSQHMLCVLAGRPANTVVARASCSGGITASTAGSRH